MFAFFALDVSKALVGALAVFFLQQFIRWVLEWNGPYTGTWKSEIFDESGQVAKIDEFKLRQRGRSIYGDIRRVSPIDQNHRSWKVKGRVRGHDFFAIFWSKNESVMSFVAWLVHQKNDREFVGYYLRLDENRHDSVTQIPIKLTRTIRNRNSRKANQ